MIGDNADADMAGARRAGWDHVHYAAETDPDPRPRIALRTGGELPDLLRG
ncbi:MAG: HAD hydrolase-like protein [Flavobacteriales bacterium]|nr:HAD hydrolase-like protein [Flavobacteriales bacterium]